MRVTLDNLSERFLADPNCIQPLTIAYGMGVDSTAMLVALVRAFKSGQQWARPELITFADTGSERIQTYNYLATINEYLAKNEFRPVQVVHRKPVQRPKWGFYNSLEEECLVKKMLPSIAYHKKACQFKTKTDPQNRLRESLGITKKAFAMGKKVIVAIGYDAGDGKGGGDTRRGNMNDCSKYTYWHPLRDLGWSRERCIEEIKREGLPVPIKSSCWFCPVVTPAELVWYSTFAEGRNYLLRIQRMEDNVKVNTAVEGYMNERQLEKRWDDQVARWINNCDKINRGEKLNRKGEVITKLPPKPPKKIVGDPKALRGLWSGYMDGKEDPKPTNRMTDFIKQEGLLKGKKALPILSQFDYPIKTCSTPCSSCTSKCA